MLGPRLSRWEKVLYVVVLVLVIASRFYLLGDRAVSHDETTHAKFSWNLYAGRGFQHDPMMHGPLLFEATALFYFLFGVSDFTARLYTVLTGIALVMAPLLFRKWLGRRGAALASVMLLISPSISYYSRYTRHDVPLMLTSVLLLWAVLQYLDEGKSRWLYGMAVFFPLMYASKENAYIYTAIFIALLALPFAWQVFRARWDRPRLFPVLVLIAVLALVLGGVFALSLRGAQSEEIDVVGSSNATMVDFSTPWWGRTAAGIAFVLALAAVAVIYYGVGEATMREMRLFDVLMVLGTLTLPLGSAFLIQFVAGADMTVFYNALMANNLSDLPMAVALAAVVVVILALAASVLLGMGWNARQWPTIALIHYAIFFVLYSTLFTWGWGFITGLVGGLAYWMAQQGVERGSQPWYYYGMIGGLYESLPLLLAAGGGLIALVQLFKPRPDLKSRDATAESAPFAIHDPQFSARFFPLFLLGWVALSWVAYTYAGEKMPWLIVHIALPNILLASWGLEQWLKDLTWQDIIAHWGWLALLALPLLVKAVLAFQQAWYALMQVLQMEQPAGQQTFTQLAPYGQILGALAGVVVFGWLLIWAANKIGARRALQLATLTPVGLLAAYTIRTMMMLNYFNYALATELIVFAHATPDVKEVLAQIDDVSWRVTGAPHDVKVAYGKDGSWPFYWYMETLYPNNYYYDTTPDPQKLLECPVVIAGRAQWDVVEPLLGTDYVSFDYKYLWWPIQDYMNLTWERIRAALSDPAMRAALSDIIKDRNYAPYARLQNPDNPFTLKTWPLRQDFRFYVRRDLAQEVWSYRLGEEGVRQMIQPQVTQMPDPYNAGVQILPPANSVTLPGAAGRGMAVARDGTLYVADTTQHRIWHITPQGSVLHSWGDYGTGPGQFNEPWDVTVDGSGNVYVADSWNHRIQKFDAQGKHLLSWGRLAQVAAYDPAGQGLFYGPRGVAIGPDGGVYVTDTGNKRVQVFDADGRFLREFGGAGSRPGQMNEPVGIAISPAGEVFVADTWNRRVQVFTAEGVFVRQWTVPVWGVDNPEEKPFLTLAGDTVYVSDPVHGRVLAFTHAGFFTWALQDSGRLTFPEGLTIVSDVLYATDGHTGQVLGYRLP